MENIKCTPNWVLIKFDNSNEYLQVGNEKLYIDTSYEKERRAQVKGYIVSFCDKLYFRHEDNGSTRYNVPIECKKGDEVLFHFNSVAISIAEGRLWKEGEFTFMFIPYDQMFASIRDGKIIPLNGWIMIEPLKEAQPQTDLLLPDTAEKVSQTRGIVRHVGCKVKDYLAYPDHSDDLIDIQEGDEVTFAAKDAVPIHDSLNAELKGFYRLHRLDIQSIVTYDGV